MRCLFYVGHLSVLVPSACVGIGGCSWGITTAGRVQALVTICAEVRTCRTKIIIA
jgi:hypothetical protein